MATCAGGRGNQEVASAFARGTRRGRGGSGVFAATGYSGAGRRQLGRVTRRRSSCAIPKGHLTTVEKHERAEPARRRPLGAHGGAVPVRVDAQRAPYGDV